SPLSGPRWQSPAPGPISAPRLLLDNKPFSQRERWSISRLLPGRPAPSGVASRLAVRRAGVAQWLPRVTGARTASTARWSNGAAKAGGLRGEAEAVEIREECRKIFPFSLSHSAARARLWAYGLPAAVSQPGFRPAHPSRSLPCSA